MPPMPIRPPPWCRTFSDRYVSRATLTLGMVLRASIHFISRRTEHCSLHRAEVEASTPCGCFYCFAPFAPTEILHMVGRNRHFLMGKGHDGVSGDASISVRRN